MSRQQHRNDPHVQMRKWLTLARRQRLPFAEAWTMAMEPGGLKWPHPTPDRHAWREALEETRPAWEAAYRGDAVPGGEVFAKLASLLVAPEEIYPSPPAFVPVIASEPLGRKKAA